MSNTSRSWWWKRRRSKTDRREQAESTTGFQFFPSLSEAALQDLPFLWVEAAILFLFSVFPDARGRNTFSTTCAHSHCFQISNDFAHHRNDEEEAFFLVLFSFWHWCASCYEHSDMNKERQLKEDKLMFLEFAPRKRDFLILYIRMQVSALTTCTS